MIAGAICGILPPVAIDAWLKVLPGAVDNLDVRSSRPVLLLASQDHLHSAGKMIWQNSGLLVLKFC